MDNTIQALQNIYVSLGGDLETTYNGEAVKNLVIIPDMLNAIAAQVTANKAAATGDDGSQGDGE